ncbi:MAG: hypothetical protein M1833_001258 [Piccolia ochrophora]|nr:MAG: hypothetical protein M1833_001258 [Piccolia ochrophora]
MQINSSVQRIVRPLDGGWEFRQEDHHPEEWLSVAQFPTNVHLDLLAHNRIPDPSIAKNEVEVQWVGEKTWIYRTVFVCSDVPPGDDVKAALAFDGLDTYATVTLNGHEILKSEDMFIPETVNVTGLLRPTNNELLITFESAYLKGRKVMEGMPNHHWGCWNGDPSRLAVRKKQADWSWDWGPALLTCGPWRPIRLEVYRAYIKDLSTRANVHQSLEHAHIGIKAGIEGPAGYLHVEMFLSDNKIAEAQSTITAGTAKVALELNKSPVDREPLLQLWYPRGYGSQPLYVLRATLLSSDGRIMDVKSQRFGLRRAEVAQGPMEAAPGSSFVVKINNVSIFCGGSCWIPADTFIPRISPGRYKKWVQLIAESNQTMVRVWGGGIFEEQAFYDACDEYGILVWQDFMFACGNYPAYPDILDLITREARANLKLLRHHPCLVILAGNNEDYQYCETEGLDYDPDDKNPDNWLQSSFPARYIYEKLLPDVTNELIPDTYYHPGSPWGGKDTRDPTVGDVHVWDVWHGSQEKYQDYDKLGGRFVSEFGMEALPSIRTIETFLPKDDLSERHPQSAVMDFHNKAAGHERRLACYLSENIRYSLSPTEYSVYCTQLIQAECLGCAHRLWRRQWQGPGKEYCAGALVWQMNDCWPVTSWSIVDYYLRPKLAYYVVKRELAPVTISMKRTVTTIPADKYTRVYIKTIHHVEIWASNLTLRDHTYDVQLKAWDIVSGTEISSKTVQSAFRLAPNRSTEIATLQIPVTHPSTDEERSVVLAAYLIDPRSGRQAARFVSWADPLKHVPLQQPRKLMVELTDDAKTVRLSAEVPVKGLALEPKDDGVKLMDNGVDLVPEEEVRIGVEGIAVGDDLADRVGVRYLDMKV